MLVQFVAGVMDGRLMAQRALAITVERLAPGPRVVARLIGATIAAVGRGLLLRS